MYKYQRIQNLCDIDFKKYTGVHKQTFQLMLTFWHQYYFSDSTAAGRPSKLSPQEQILLTLEYCS